MENLTARRRDEHTSRKAQLAMRHWELSQELEGINREIRFLSGASQECEKASREVDSFSAVIDSQANRIKELEAEGETTQEE